MKMKNNYPLFPLYIPTKGRSEYLMTSKVLNKMGVHHYLIVEKEQEKQYLAAIKQFEISAEILILDNKYKKEYQLCDNLGLSKSTGPGPARNFAWDHSSSNGFKWHWVMDDNISCFYRLNKNMKLKVWSPGIFRAMEDFTLRYENVTMAGPNYSSFAVHSDKLPPFSVNTRIYSCNLIKNHTPFRWRGRYNEDTILSLDMLKAGFCTIQFYAFLQEKMQTQMLGGGNTKEFYLEEGQKKAGQKYAETGTINKTRMLVAVHPDVSKMVFKYGRVHHQVDYRRFKKENRLIKMPNGQEHKGQNEYGMVLTCKPADKV